MSLCTVRPTPYPVLYLLPAFTETVSVTDSRGNTRHLLAPKPADPETLTAAISSPALTISSLPSTSFFSSTKRNKTDTGFFEIKFYTKRILRYTMSCYLIHIVSTRTTASIFRVNLRCTREQQVLPKRRYIPQDVVYTASHDKKS